MTTNTLPPAGFVPRFHPRILGSAAPVFPGFEVDILDRVPDAEREDAVWHRGRAKAMIKAHPEKLAAWLDGVTTRDGRPALAIVQAALAQ